MFPARSRTLLVVGAVALGLPAASAPASAANATTSCAKQTKALTAAKKRLRRAKTTSSKATAKRRVTRARRSLTTCRRRQEPATKKPPKAPAAPSAPVAPAPVVSAPVPVVPTAPSPGPSPTPGPSLDTLNLAPTAPSTKDSLLFRWSPPAGGPLATEQPVLELRTPAGDPRTCVNERSEVVADGARGFERRFSPFGYPPLDPSKPTLPALSDWCPGSWTATVAYRDAATGRTSAPVSAYAFTVSLYVP